MTQESSFSDAVFVPERALAYGFTEKGGTYRFEKLLCGGQFCLEVEVPPGGGLFTRTLDVLTQEPYVLHRVEGAKGMFVEQVRAEYLAALQEIAQHCFERSAFRSDCSAALLRYARERYGDEPEYLWQRFPSNAVLRRQDNRRWYAAFLTVAAQKLGLPGEETLEIVDLRMVPEQIAQRVDGAKIFPGWHMNKKNWVTALLDGSVPPEELAALLDESYRLAGKKQRRNTMVNARNKKLGEARSVIREIFEYGNARKREIGEENVYDFSIGNPGVPAPHEVNEEIVRLVGSMPSLRLHGYTSAAGAPEVREAVAQYIHTAFGVPMSADGVYMTCGAAASLTITLNALCEEGDEFVVVTPCFPEYSVFIESAGGKVVAAAAGSDFHLDMAALDAAVGARTKGVIINSPNNPTGAVYTRKELAALAALLEKKSAQRGEPVFLIADEPYRELTYGAEVPYPMAFYADTIVCYSFSKSLSLAGERIGYIAVSPRCKGAADVFSAVCGAGRALGFVCAPALFQRVVATCLGKSGDVEEYRKNRDLLLNTLTECGFSCIPPEGAFYLFMRSPEPDAAAFCERAKAHELLLVPSDGFGVKGYVRVSYCVERAVIERSIPAFRALAREHGLI